MNKGARTLSLRTRILLPITVIMVAAFAVIYVVTASVFGALRTRSGAVAAEIMAGAIEGSIAQAMVSGWQSEIQSMLKSITHLSPVPEISVRREDGTYYVMSGTRLGELEKLPRDLPAAGMRKTTRLALGREQFVRVTTSFDNEQRCQNCHSGGRKTLGYLQVTLPGVWLEEGLLNAEHLVLVVAGVALVLIWLAVTWVVDKAVLSRVSGFIESIAGVKRGERDVRAKSTMDDELGRVAHAFNDMVDEIKRTETTLVQREQQLARSEKLAGVGLMASGVAHQINNPLAAASTAAEMILESELTDAQVRQMARLIVESTGRIRDIVADLLTLDKQQGLVREKVDVGELINASVREVDFPGGIHVISDIRSDVPQIIADRTMLGRAFVNILDNACRAMPQGGEVRIRAEAAEGGVRITMADTGCGMSEEVAAHVFDPFFTTREVGEGFGLGLAVAHGAITKHGGTIMVISEPGKGSTFEIVLPGGDSGEQQDA